DQWLSGRSLDSTAPPGTLFSLKDPSWKQYTTAIVIEHNMSGFISILGLAQEINDIDHLTVERGALVCAVEIAKQQAVFAVEHQVHGEFLDIVLTTGNIEEPALIRRAIELEYPLECRHTVIHFDLDIKLPRYWTMIEREFRIGLGNSKANLFFCTYETAMVAIYGEQQADMGMNYRVDRELIKSADLLRDRMKRLFPELKIAIGIGMPGDGLPGLRQSFKQAVEAVNMVHTYFQRDRTVAYGDMRLHNLLLSLRESSELAGFYESTLAPLEKYDSEHDGQLALSLRAFFRHHGNISRTAEAINLHRNSLLYRLERINNITGLNLDEADDRFALQLALKLQPLLHHRD
ncbi:MAG: helix-turn-helix domain-containing protein, partial [Anaerolineae bacterium]|nr:helix-turn-helix domain-containing protein [Anaerolineae bacterium]